MKNTLRVNVLNILTFELFQIRLSLSAFPADCLAVHPEFCSSSFTRSGIAVAMLANVGYC